MKNFTPMLQNGWKLNKLLFDAQEWITNCAEETIDLGRQFGETLLPGAVLCLFGDLGSGKTTLVKGIVWGATGLSFESIASPTFVYMTPYQGPKGVPLYHFDLYRLKDPEEFLYLGFEDYLHAGGICCIEWSEKIIPLLPQEAKFVQLQHWEQEKRKIHYGKVPF